MEWIYGVRPMYNVIKHILKHFVCIPVYSIAIASWMIPTMSAYVCISMDYNVSFVYFIILSDILFGIDCCFRATDFRC